MEKKGLKNERLRDSLKIREASELSSLCVLCFGPAGGDDVATWPEDQPEARVSAAGNNRRRKKESNLDLSEILLDSEIEALRNNKQISDDQAAADPVSRWDDEQLDLLSKESLLALSSCLESKIRAIDNRIGFLRAQERRERHVG